MGGAPPLPLDFASQGVKNGHFLAIFGPPRILLWVADWRGGRPPQGGPPEWEAGAHKAYPRPGGLLAPRPDEGPAGALGDCWPPLGREAL